MSYNTERIEKGLTIVTAPAGEHLLDREGAFVSLVLDIAWLWDGKAGRPDGVLTKGGLKGQWVEFVQALP